MKRHWWGSVSSEIFEIHFDNQSFRSRRFPISGVSFLSTSWVFWLSKHWWTEKKNQQSIRRKSYRSRSSVSHDSHLPATWMEVVTGLMYTSSFMSPSLVFHRLYWPVTLNKKNIWDTSWYQTIFFEEQSYVPSIWEVPIACRAAAADTGRVWVGCLGLIFLVKVLITFRINVDEM